MGILNLTSDGIPSAFVALHSALRTMGPLSRERLLGLCAPPSLTAGRGLASKTLTRWMQLGAFEGTEESVSLSAALDRVAPRDLKGLSAELLALALSQANNPVGEGPDGMAASEEDADEEAPQKAAASTTASDFTRAAAWALQQDPFNFPADWGGVERLIASQRPRGEVLRNDTRWNGFTEWASFLGVVTYLGKDLCVSPAAAVRHALVRVFREGDTRLSQGVFLERLAKELPLVDGGTYFVAMAERLQAPWHRLAPSELSPCLSLALGQLHSAGALRLLDLSDAPQRVMLGRGGQRVRTFTHVERAA